MKEQIEKLEAQLKKLKEVYEIEERMNYENKEHKHFEKGDLVTDGNHIGIVEWVENQCINILYKNGYMGVSLQNGSRGFLAGTKRDLWVKVEDSYYQDLHKVEINLTGLEIEEIKYSLGYRNCNPNKSKTKLLDVLDSIKTL